MIKINETRTGDCIGYKLTVKLNDRYYGVGTMCEVKVGTQDQIRSESLAVSNFEKIWRLGLRFFPPVPALVMSNGFHHLKDCAGMSFVFADKKEAELAALIMMYRSEKGCPDVSILKVNMSGRIKEGTMKMRDSNKNDVEMTILIGEVINSFKCVGTVNKLEEQD